MLPQVVVDDLEQREGVPVVFAQRAEHRIHVDREQRPERLLVLNQQVGEPGEGLSYSIEHRVSRAYGDEETLLQSTLQMQSIE